MSIQAVLLPLFVEVALTFVLLFWTGYLRANLLKVGAVKPQDVALREPNWPPQVAQICNAYQNQFEVPVLFYVLTILAWMTRHADLLFVVMAWIFVALAWTIAQAGVTSAIASATSAEQLAELMGAVELELPAEDVAALEGAGKSG